MRASIYGLVGLGWILGGITGAKIPEAGSGWPAAAAAVPPPPPARPAAAAGIEESDRWAAIAPERDGEQPASREPTPHSMGGIPERLVIPAIGLDAPVVPAGSRVVWIEGRRYREWLAPDRRAVGWHPTSAPIGEPGNTVLSGHHNIAGAVFRRLAEVKIGDRIQVDTRDGRFLYVVVERHILLERGQPLAVRLANARWIQPFPDERLTLVTCWPLWDNSHRLIVVARPVR